MPRPAERGLCKTSTACEDEVWSVALVMYSLVIESMGSNLLHVAASDWWLRSYLVAQVKQAVVFSRSTIYVPDWDKADRRSLLLHE